MRDPVGAQARDVIAVRDIETAAFVDQIVDCRMGIGGEPAAIVFKVHPCPPRQGLGEFVEVIGRGDGKAGKIGFPHVAVAMDRADVDDAGPGATVSH
ncbi:MAG TPA: hypothetical protein VN034_08320 [Sphingopyxis sp.]|nr:hypothetical protein [Sphingopyxis sp.]